MDGTNKRLPLAVTLILLTSMLILPCANEKAASKTITVPNDYATISAAIGNAANGDTIIVKNGVYVEQTLQINKSLSIISENVNGAHLILHPPQIAENLFGQTVMVYTNPIVINADNVELSGFMITSDGGSIEANGNQIQIVNNDIIGSQNTAIALTLNGNGTQIINNLIGPLSLDGSNQTITGNQIAGRATIWNNNYNLITGAVIMGDYNLISNNNAPTIGISGDRNIVTGNSVIWNTSAGAGDVGIELADADYNIVCNNTESGNNVGVAIAYGLTIYRPEDDGGSYNVFAGNTVKDAVLWGILMGNGSYNVFYGNLVTDCGGAGHDGYGLAIGGEDTPAGNNLFFYNSFMNNSKDFGTNWQVIGSNFFDNGTVGNYWDDYLTKYPNATEIGNSGIGNTPYLVYNNVTDNYPLINRPDVSDAVPALPSPWAQLVPFIAVSSQVKSLTASTPEFPSITILTVLFAASLLIAIVAMTRKNKLNAGEKVILFSWVSDIDDFSQRKLEAVASHHPAI